VAACPIISLNEPPDIPALNAPPKTPPIPLVESPNLLSNELNKFFPRAILSSKNFGLATSFKPPSMPSPKFLPTFLPVFSEVSSISLAEPLNLSRPFFMLSDIMLPTSSP